jgi:hypothetical protein
MKEKNGHEEPCARQEGLIVRELPDELLVYDLVRDKAHCLNQTAALVWKSCDGETPVARIAQRLERELKAPVDERVVWYALDQLGRDHLLEVRTALPVVLAGMTRRQMVRALGVAALVALPVVTTIVAPTPAQATTCGGSGAPCTTSANCCPPSICSSGFCT